ncbi:MAG TPA: hypothetical protein VNL18_01275 [Gemmatimonadales bacterium]|nr:hypothetical protein [Gemmatimonadales bacterium]
MTVAVRYLTLLWALLVVACTQPAAQSATAGSPDVADSPASGRMLVAIPRQEPSSPSATVLLTAGIGSTATQHPFDAGLVILNGEEVAVPYLVERLPRLNTESWRVLPDGRIETTYRLRPGLSWHDSTSLKADDFFAWQVYTTLEFGTATTPPHPRMSYVQEPDVQTVVISWSDPFPGAGALEGLGGAGLRPSFAPLPRHLL